MMGSHWSGPILAKARVARTRVDGVGMIAS